MRYKAISELSTTDLADEGKSLSPHPLGTVAEPDSELIDEIQAQVISTTCIQLLEDLHNLRIQKVAIKSAVNLNI